MPDSSGKQLIIALSGCMGNPDDTLAFFTGLEIQDAEALRLQYPELRVAVNLKMSGNPMQDTAGLSETSDSSAR